MSEAFVRQSPGARIAILDNPDIGFPPQITKPFRATGQQF
jgi:hypothetical protein